jgi:pyridoxine 5-phosphate synthase
MLTFAEDLRPADCCLVPERRDELTTEGGLDVAAQTGAISTACERLASRGIRVSLFIDPEPSQLQAARATGAPVVELHTGAYADAADSEQAGRELARIASAARHAAELGLRVHAGHGLHYHNVQPVAAIPEIVELNIGHAIVARAVLDGFPAAVARMRELMDAARRG